MGPFDSDGGTPVIDRFVLDLARQGDQYEDLAVRPKGNKLPTDAPKHGSKQRRKR